MFNKNFSLVKKILFILVFVFLTITTQIGGVILVLTAIGTRKRNNRFTLPLAFTSVYLLCTFLIIPPLAKVFGREKISNNSKLRPTSYWTVILNRNYVEPHLNDVLQDIANDLPEDYELRYLDACLPFINGFPLLPHLSHNDGKKIDVSFMYVEESGTPTNLKPSRSGYGVFEAPRDNEFNQINQCKRQGHWQYDYSKYLTLGTPNKELKFSETRTKILINSMLKNSNTHKIFIEPHLKQRLGIKNQKVRFHGCGAVRHDDHIHLQIH